MAWGCSASAPSVSGAGGAAGLPKPLLSSTEGLPQSHRPVLSPVTTPRRASKVPSVLRERWGEEQGMHREDVGVLMGCPGVREALDT